MNTPTTQISPVNHSASRYEVTQRIERPKYPAASGALGKGQSRLEDYQVFWLKIDGTLNLITSQNGDVTLFQKRPGEEKFSFRSRSKRPDFEAFLGRFEPDKDIRFLDIMAEPHHLKPLPALLSGSARN